MKKLIVVILVFALVLNTNAFLFNLLGGLLNPFGIFGNNKQPPAPQPQ